MDILLLNLIAVLRYLIGVRLIWSERHSVCAEHVARIEVFPIRQARNLTRNNFKCFEKQYSVPR